MRRFLAAFARNTTFVNVCILLIFIGGFCASMFMIRERFPMVGIDLVTVTVPYPGADPEEVEEAIAVKIEEAVNGLEGIKEYTTQSHEGYCVALMKVHESYDVNLVKDEVETRIDAISSFPVDAERPIIEKPMLIIDVLKVAVIGARDERRLKEYAELIKREIQNLPEASQVSVSGEREYEIAIEVSKERLREYGLTFHDVSMAVRASSQSLAGGTMRTQGEEIRLRTIGRKYWGDEFRKIEVMATPQGEVITLDRVATVRDTFTENPVLARLNGERTILLRVDKTTSEDSIAIANAVKRYVKQKQATLPEGLRLVVWHDLSFYIDSALRVLFKNCVLGLILVFFLLWMFLDLRLSFWSSMGIPISICGALTFLWFGGNTLNITTLFGLLVVVGIIVDDAIVIGEAIYVHRQRGDAPLAAAVNGVAEVGMPIVAAVTTTVIAFTPLLFVGGFMGKFVRILPIAVIAALAFSTFECIFMLPAHLSHLPDTADPKYREKLRRNPLRRLRTGIGNGLEWFIEHLYAPFLRRVLHHRYLSMAVVFAVMLVSYGVYQGGLVKFVMFPPVDSHLMRAWVEFPNGTPIEVTQAAVERMEDALKRVAARTPMRSGEPMIKNLYTVAGAGMDPFPGEIVQNDPRLGALKAELLDADERGVHVNTLLAEWEKETGAIPGAVSMRFKGDDSGPPGRPIEIWVQGDRLDRILSASEELVAQLRQFDGVSQVESDFRLGKNEIRFQLKPEARTLGITVGDLARQVYAGYYGEEALRLQRGRDDIRVRVRYPVDERGMLSELYRIRIRTPFGTEVPLRSVAEMSYGPGYSIITRTNGQRRVAVSAAVDISKTNALEVIGKLERDFFAGLKKRHYGIELSIQGEEKDTQESLSTLFIGYPLALVAIYFVVASLFRSYIQPFIILGTVPLGIIGAMYGHMIYGSPITMFSIFGIVALAGVVVNDAIVLIECVNSLLASGTSFFESLVRGGTRRFRAIFLTTISTCGGLTPMIFETERVTLFVVPMALSLTFGVAFATLITLLVIPSLLAIVNDLRRALYWFHFGELPTREAVEPAARRGEGQLDADKGEAAKVA